MRRIFQSSLAIGLFTFASFSLGSGCHVIAGLEDRSLTGGSGGASSSSGGIPAFPCLEMLPEELNCSVAVECPAAQVATDACHCGECDVQCGDNNICDNGICRPKLFVQLPNFRIHRATVNRGAVYFAAYDEEANRSDIRVASFDGTLVPNSLNTTRIDGFVTAIDADCTNVYYSTVANGGMAEQSLWWIPLQGGVPQKVPKPADGDVGGSETIVHNDRLLFWTDGRGVGVWEIGSDKMSERIPVEPGFKAVGLAIDGNTLYWSEVQDTDMQSHLHMATINDSGAVSPSGEFFAYPGSLRRFALDGSNFYLLTSDAASGSAVRVMTKGSLKDATTTILAFPPMGSKLGEAIFADSSDDYVYFNAIDSGKGATRRVKKPGIMSGEAEIPTPQFDEQWLIGNSKRLYLITPRNGINGQIDWVGR